MKNEKPQRAEGGRWTKGLISETRPLVTIITAVYDGHATLEETIKSVIGQFYTNFEYLVIDGGSTDGTIELLAKYDDAIDYWVSEPDNGVYDAFNKGIDLARGEWLIFLGSDDTFVDHTVISKVFSKDYQSKMLYGNVVWGNSARIYDGKFSKTKLYYDNICQQSIFYHKDLFKMLGKFDLKYRLLADWVLNLRAFADKRINPTYIDTIISVYSIDGMSMTDEDHCFAVDRPALIREIFGFCHFVNFTWIYPHVAKFLKRNGAAARRI